MTLYDGSSTLCWMGKPLARRRGRWPRLAQARRDVAMVWNGLTGRAPSPFVSRPARPGPEHVDALAPADPLAPRELRITRVVRETPDAVSLYLDDPSGRPLHYRPGQFFTVFAEVRGQLLRRAYSLASAPDGEIAPHVTVKRIPGGRVSNLLHDGARAGDVLRVRGPSGAFTVSPDPGRARHAVMVAGGSGITPIMGMTQALLEGEPHSRVTLVYGNRRYEDIIFRERLEWLRTNHPGRLTVDHVLEHPREGWDRPVGRLDRAMVDGRLDAWGVSAAADVELYVCGPTPMMDAVRESLAARGVERERIHEELFTSPEKRTAPEVTGPHPVTVRVGGKAYTAVASAGQSVLEAGLGAGAPMPFSCTMGGCGSCRVHLASGDVEMDEPNCLRPDERDRGEVLACVARPGSAVTVEVS